MVAALRPRMLRLAGREADGAILNWLSAVDVGQVVSHVHAAEPGTECPGKEIVARIFVLPTEDSDTARGLARRMRYLNVPVYAAFHEWLGRGDLLPGMWSAWQAGDRKAAVAAVPDDVVDDLFVHGPVGACREQIEAYREAG